MSHIHSAAYSNSSGGSRDGVVVSIHGKHIRLSPEKGGVKSFESIVGTLRRVTKDKELKNVKSLTLFVQEPLLPYIRREETIGEAEIGGLPAVEKWVHSGPFAEPEGETLTLKVLMALLQWKLSQIDRDCVIVSCMDIPGILF